MVKVKTVEKEGDQNGSNVLVSEYIQNIVGRWLKCARLGRIDSGTISGVVGKDWSNCSMQRMNARCNAVSSRI